MSICAKEAAFKELLLWTQNEPAHRYEVYDTHMEVNYRLYIAKDAIAKATELSSTAFQCRLMDRTVEQIRYVNGIWMHEGGSMLSTVQRLFDHEALFHIMRRLEMRAEIDELQSPDVEEVMALADTVAFRRIQDLPAQQSAASVIAVHARSNPLYREALKRALPRLDIYGKVQELTGVGLDPDEIPF